MSYGFLHRWTLSARSSVVRTTRPPRRVLDRREIAAGWQVVDLDGQSVGTVRGRDADYLVLSRGLIRSRLYVPLTAVRGVTEGTVRLNLPASVIDEGRWAKRPRSLR